MKSIAQRFGAIPRGLFYSDRRLFDMSARFESTPIYEETMREAKLVNVDIQLAEKVIRAIAEGTVRVECFLSEESPTPQAYFMLNKLVEVPELMAPESTKKDGLSRMKSSLMAQRIQLICLKCGSVGTETRVEALAEYPKCVECGSGLLALQNKARADLPRILEKWKSKEPLSEEERRALSQARRSADLILSYGQQAALALLTWGVGPQTASAVLAKMHTAEEDFYSDLLKAKLRYIQTRPFWDR
jgi:ATP-dependent Lhr-like helicase